jgi:hypothetical protein
MKDIEVFKKFMGWMSMNVSEEKQLDDGKTLITFIDSNTQTKMFTKQGYNEFSAGAIFDVEGNILKGYIDSHVAFSSENFDLLNNL